MFKVYVNGRLTAEYNSLVKAVHNAQFRSDVFCNVVYVRRADTTNVLYVA